MSAVTSLIIFYIIVVHIVILLNIIRINKVQRTLIENMSKIEKHYINKQVNKGNVIDIKSRERTTTH